MKALQIKDKIIDNLEYLNSFQLSELFDFTEFMIYKNRLVQEKRIPNRKTTDTMRKTDAGEELTQYDDINDFYREMGI